MKYDVITIEELIKKSEEKELLLPNFQRDFVWDKDNQQKGLFSSLFYDIPIGSLLILEGENNFFASKELGIRETNTSPLKESILYLLDGQQRVSTMKSMFYDFFSDIDNWEENWGKLYGRLRNRWFIQVIPKEDMVDLFGWELLKFKGEEILMQIEPDDVNKYIHCEVINKRQSQKWFHPEFQKDKWYKEGVVKSAERNRVLKSIMAKEGKVPIYTLLVKKPSDGLHYHVLCEIARLRVEELKSKIQDNEMSITEIFDEDISSLEEYEIQELWDSLKNDWVSAVCEFLSKIKEKEIPYIKLSKDEMGRAIHTFEKVNKGGTPLSVYDLIVAKVAQVNKLQTLTERIESIVNEELILPISLTSKLKGVRGNYNWTPKVMNLIDDKGIVPKFKDQYLNLLSIFSYCTYGYPEEITLEHIKKPMHLALQAEQIDENTHLTVKALCRACAFLQFRCGVTKFESLGYKLMVLPIAYVLRDDEKWNDQKCIDKLEYWYWCSLFGGAYRESPNKRCKEDIKELYRFITEDENNFVARQKRVFEVADYSDYDALTFKGEAIANNTNVHNGILQYVLSKQPRDFIESEVYLNAWTVAEESEIKFTVKNITSILKLEDHHICPLGTAKKIGESTKVLRSKKDFILNSPLNRTYISSISNNLISDKKIEDYFKYVSEMAQFGHCIATPFAEKYRQLDGEIDDVYYERIIKMRYDEIRKELIKELDELI